VKSGGESGEHPDGDAEEDDADEGCQDAEEVHDDKPRCIG